MSFEIDLQNKTLPIKSLNALKKKVGKLALKFIEGSQINILENAEQSQRNHTSSVQNVL